ncbi:hypothetical protein J2S43_008161 [Catenuloplanes nepalensis]|uniref:Glycosyltransferase RgtA/B/C/D-like domain-containing protein n=1 Tax=Catenuloplanes nepalensis TaxID=587533 RepID=A0ABT9N7H5_9ACTN|nr:hypothetical protein [Catenuloplanes nepalensis]MDP9799649.1 hypothetical protein [Catenuloplanes nepalensis]
MTQLRTVRTAGPDTTARLTLSAGSLLLLPLAGLFELAGAHGPRSVALLAFALLGLGSAPWAPLLRLPAGTRLALTALTALALPVVVGTGMLLTGLWYPVAAFVLLTGAAVVAHGLSLLREPITRPALDGAASGLIAVLGGALCLGAAFTHRHLDPGLWGFLVHIGPFWYAGLALILIGLATARADAQTGLAITVLVLALTLTLTPALVYDGPRSQSANKHVELVQQIRALGALDSSVRAYNAWPGFFAGAAWLCDAAGLRDPMRLAIAWPPLMAVFRVVALRYLAGRVLTSPYQAWIAVALAVLADPIGADYFSPQSLGFVLGLLAFGLALADLRHRIALLAATGTVLAVTHQLSPYIIGGILVVLAAFRWVRPWWTPATVLLPAIVWTLVHFSAVSAFLSLRDVGDAANFRPPSTTAVDDLERLPVVTVSVVALAAGIVLLGLVAAGVLVTRRRDERAWAMAACPAVGLIIIAGNAYGNEGIFRAALFGIPWLALLAAGAFTQRRRPALLALTAALTTTFVTAAFSMDATNVSRPGDRAAFRYFLDRPRGSWMLILGAGDLPSVPPTRERTHVSVYRPILDPIADRPAAETPAQAVPRLTALLKAYADREANWRTDHLYAVWSPVTLYYGWEYGLHTRDDFAALRDAFATAPGWSVAFRSGETVVFAYRGAG